MGRSKLVFGRAGVRERGLDLETMWDMKYERRVEHQERMAILMTGDRFLIKNGVPVPAKFPWQYQYARRRWWEIVKDDILARLER